MTVVAAARRLSPWLVFCIVYSDIGTSVYYVPGQLYGSIGNLATLAQLITTTDATRPTVLVSLGSPYLLNQTPTVKSYLIAWSGVRASERAVALALLGKVRITGRLPIRLPPDYPIGAGVTIPDARP